MSNSLKEESVKEMLNMLKGDYNFPVKLWVWGLCKALHNPHYAKKVVMQSRA